MLYNSHLAKTSNEANERLVRTCVYVFIYASRIFVIRYWASTKTLANLTEFKSFTICLFDR